MARSPDDIATDIGRELAPLKPDANDPHDEILRSIECVGRIAPMYREASSSAFRDRARLCQKMLADLDDGAPAELTQMLKKHGSAIRATGPDKRFDWVGWDCAFQAVLLTEKFSKNEPVGTPEGVIHSIAKYIFEAVTGKRPTKTQILKACRSALDYRKQPI